MKKIILLSGKMESGKNTTATLLKKELEKSNYRVKELAFADTFKVFCKNKLDWNGEKDKAGRQLLITVGSRLTRLKWTYIRTKDKFIDEKGKEVNPRRYKSLDQATFFDKVLDIFSKDKNYYGYKDYSLTDIYNICERHFIFSDTIWTEFVYKFISQYKNKYDYFIITDHRFMTEYNILNDVLRDDVIAVRVDNDRVSLLDNFTETELDLFDFDFRINNNYTMKNLKTEIKYLTVKLACKEI